MLDLSVNRTEIYVGESVILEARVSGLDPPAEPDLSALRGCAIKPLGSRDISNWTIVIVNGRMRREGFSGRVYSYELIPSRPGPLVAGPVRVRAGGVELAAPGPVIRVAGIEPQPFVEVAVAASRSSVLVDEPFEIRLRVRIRRLSGTLAEADPLFPDAPPNLSVPFLAVGAPEGLRGPDVIQILNARLARAQNEPGFTVNTYTTRADPFDFGRFFDMGSAFDERPAKFHFDRRTVEDNGVARFEYGVTLAYTPEKEGDYTFGPVIFKGKVPTGTDARGNVLSRDIFTVGPAAIVRVVPPPESDRPDSYIGAIGSNLTVTAGLDAQTCNVGDPLQLALSVSGDVQMRNVYPPKLGLQSNLVALFDVYDDSVRTVSRDGGKTFCYTLRPRVPGSYELPPVDVSYYDVSARTYRTVRSAALPFKARQSAEITASQVIAPATNGPAPPRPDTAPPFGVAPIRLDPAGAESAPLLGGALPAAVAAAGPLAFGLALAVRHAARFRRRRADTRRRRRALRRARHAVAAARRAAATKGTAAGPALSAALRDYVGERFDVPGRSLTPADALDILRRHGIDAAVVLRLHTLMDRLFNAGYGPSTEGDARADCTEADTLLCAIEADLQRSMPRRGETVVPGLLLPALVLAGVMLTPGPSRSERQFAWNEANARMSAARTPRDFLRCAEAYQQLLDMGVRNGSLFYNLGTALLKAERYDDAVTALLRAERYGGSDVDIAENLQVALARGDRLKVPPTPWTRFLVFWHYRYAASARALAAAAAFAVFWLALALRSLGARHLAGPLMVVALVAVALLGSSVATTLHQEAHARRWTAQATEADTPAATP